MGLIIIVVLAVLAAAGVISWMAALGIAVIVATVLVLASL